MSSRSTRLGVEPVGEVEGGWDEGLEVEGRLEVDVGVRIRLEVDEEADVEGGVEAGRDDILWKRRGGDGGSAG